MHEDLVQKGTKFLGVRLDIESPPFKAAVRNALLIPGGGLSSRWSNGKVGLMNTRPSDDCTYKSGDETCFRPDCPISCMRNYKDQLNSDVPLVSQAPKAQPQPPSWWQARFGQSKASRLR
jgi:hypothetical protein